jgi:hypothetical protein
MTTPSTFGTVFNIIRDGMVEAGYLGRGRDPTSDHLALYTNKLNYTFNYLQTRPGLKLWLNFDLPITLVAGRGLYTLGPSGNVPMTKPIRGFEAYYVDSNANRRPVTIIGRSEWDMLSTTTQQGTITSVYVDKQQFLLNVNTWLTPDTQNATGILHLIVTQQITQMVSLTDTMSFPVEWYLTLMWQFAAQICTGQPASVIKRCTEMAAMHLEVLEDWDVEDASTSFVVDQRSVTVSRFR